MINKVILIGNVGSDPEIRTLENGDSVANISVATSEGYKDKQGQWQNVTEWHKVNAWGFLAERIEKDAQKGMRVYIEGKLKTNKWQDKEGNNRYTTVVLARVLRILNKTEADSLASVNAESVSAKGNEVNKSSDLF